ncbi:MAG: rhodanese-like domain-containing protein [Peptostreptococcaceae bacterium]|nr:rhodanese-like domain-containing protein [Peptostreptococcaceae bacterium]
MEKFDEMMRNFDLDYFGNGRHKMPFDKAIALQRSGEAFILDVRTRPENELIFFGFATNIPTNEIPDRLDEIPMDKTVAIFCTSGNRATIVYAYLLNKGYKDVKVIANSISDIAGTFKPGYVLSNYGAHDKDGSGDASK